MQYLSRLVDGQTPPVSGGSRKQLRILNYVLFSEEWAGGISKRKFIILN